MVKKAIKHNHCLSRFWAEDWHDCKFEWPEEVFVQCGENGLVLVEGGKSYNTSFFEAFPHGTFIRGEGKLIEEAETNAWMVYQRQIACKLDHNNPGNFDPKDYKNGLGFCKSCNMSLSGIISQVCCNCKVSTNKFVTDKEGNFWCKDCEDQIGWNSLGYYGKLARLKKEVASEHPDWTTFQVMDEAEIRLKNHD